MVRSIGIAVNNKVICYTYNKTVLNRIKKNVIML